MSRRRKTWGLFFALLATMAIALVTPSVASAAPMENSFQLMSANDAACRGSLYLEVRADVAVARTRMDCYDSGYFFNSLSAQANVYPEDSPNFDWVDSGCLDCQFAQAYKRIPIGSADRGRLFCATGTSIGTTEIERPWGGGAPKLCARVP